MDNNNEFVHVDEEQTPQPSDGQAQMVSPGRGYHWVERSLSEIFVPHFGKWFLAGLIYSIVTTVLPMLGVIIAMLVLILNPLFLAGGYLGANKVQQKSGEVTPQQFFEGFSHPKKFALLAYCGIFAAIGGAIVYVILSAIGIEQLQSIDWQIIQAGSSPEAVQVEMEAFASVIGPYVLWIILSFIALSLANWFAVNLIMFQEQNPLSALLNSFIGGIKNLLAMIVLVLVLIGLGIAVGLIAMLVGALVSAVLPPVAADLLLSTLLTAVLMPVMVGIGYMSYREVYLGDVKKSKNTL
ncbi:BPSS1780 family membrane protein [Kangiella sp. M94]